MELVNNVACITPKAQIGRLFFHEYAKYVHRKDMRMVVFYYFCSRKLKFVMMEQGMFYEICGWVASIGMILGYLPQAIKTIRTRNTDGIALPTFLMMAVGAFAFMLQGLLHEPEILWSLFLTNLITATCSCIVFGIKMYNDYFKGK